MNRLLEVRLGDRPIGTLALLPGDRSFFSFEEAYLHDPRRPILSQSFLKPSGELIGATRVTQVKLPPFFSNLLPEGHLRRYLAERGGIKPEREFLLLELLGADLPGAVRVSSMADSPPSTERPEQAEAGSPAARPYRFSLAGVQLKFSAIAEAAGGLTIPADGIGGDWIIKLPSLTFPHVPENEWAMLHLAGVVGIPVPEARLTPLSQIAGLPDLGLLSGARALAVRRFDRGPRGQRIHIEDLAQVYNLYPADKYGKVSYANIANMLWTLTGETGLTDFIRRLAFAILIGNGDPHLKNWSLIYPDTRTPALAPAYDLVATIPYIPDDRLALTLGDTRDMRAITLEHFQKLAKKAQAPSHLVLETVRDTVAATLSGWHDHNRQYDLPDDMTERIARHMRSVGLARG